MLALATVVVTSCSAPRMAQQTNSDDDVYNTTATAKVYTPAPVVAPSQTEEEPVYNEDDYYGTSDPYYDQDYSSRINRFYYASPWRTYYDPYYYSGWYSDFGWGSYAGMGWGYMTSPFWGWNSWGYNNWGWNSYYGGGFMGGGYYGGGLYGGGYYTGRTTNVPDYRSRPRVGRENGVGYNSRFGNPRSSVVRTDANGKVISGRSRSERYNPDAKAPSRVDRGSSTRPTRAETTRPQTQERPTRTEAPRPTRTESRPTYTPPARTESSRGSSSSSGSGSSSRPTRAGRG